MGTNEFAEVANFSHRFFANERRAGVAETEPHETVYFRWVGWVQVASPDEQMAPHILRRQRDLPEELFYIEGRDMGVGFEASASFLQIYLNLTC